MGLILPTMNIAGRPFLNGRLECDDPQLFDDVRFFIDPTAAQSFVATKALRTSPLPKEILGAKFRTHVPLPQGTLEEYEITFRRLKVVEYTENKPLPSTFGRDFLSVCPMTTIEGRVIVQMKDYKITVNQ
jgi:hypothetical protein